MLDDLSSKPTTSTRRGAEFVIAGDSHIFAMGATQSYAGPPTLSPAGFTGGQGFFLLETWHGGRGASYWDTLVEVAPSRAVVLVLMGNQHFANFLFASSPLFDFLEPGESAPAIHPRAVAVPRRMVASLPVFSTARVREIAQRVKAAGCTRLVICGTPPVREDFGDALESIRKSSFFQGVATRLGIDIHNCEVTPPQIMKRLWGVVQDALSKAATDNGAMFLPAPSDTRTSDGYLLPQYRGPLEDFAHANPDYGKKMLLQIVRTLESSP